MQYDIPKHASKQPTDPHHLAKMKIRGCTCFVSMSQCTSIPYCTCLAVIASSWRTMLEPDFVIQYRLKTFIKYELLKLDYLKRWQIHRYVHRIFWRNIIFIIAICYCVKINESGGCHLKAMHCTSGDTLFRINHEMVESVLGCHLTTDGGTIAVL